MNAGLIDEFTIALSPVLSGSGIRLFEGVDAGRVALEPVRAEPTQRVTHLTYAVLPGLESIARISPIVNLRCGSKQGQWSAHLRDVRL